MQRILSASLLIACAIVLSAPTTTFAQFQTALTISSDVSHPGPQEKVRLSLESPIHNLDAGTITWRRDGAVILQGTGERRVEITLGALGSETRITASFSDGESAGSASVTFAPSRVAILWESDAYTPRSYQGRTLPSAGTKVRLWAIPYATNVGSSAAGNLTYTWKLNGAKLANLSGRGKSSVTIGSPELFGSYTVSVEVTGEGGTARGEGRVRITSVEPGVRLYANHPLFGLQYWSAIPATAFIPEREMSFSAVPYFVPTQSPDDSALSYAWRIDRKAVSADPERPSTITISTQDEGVLALIDLTLTHATNFLLESRGAWQVTLGVGSGAGIFDPFRATE